MNTQDFLNVSVGLGFLVLVGSVSFACFRLVETLKSIKKLTDDAIEITGDVKSLKDQFELGVAKFLNAALTTGTMLLKKKGGGKRGKQ